MTFNSEKCLQSLSKIKNLSIEMKDSSRECLLKRLHLPRAMVKRMNKQRLKMMQMTMKMKRKTLILCSIVKNQLMKRSKSLKETLSN